VRCEYTLYIYVNLCVSFEPNFVTQTAIVCQNCHKSQVNEEFLAKLTQIFAYILVHTLHFCVVTTNYIHDYIRTLYAYKLFILNVYNISCHVYYVGKFWMNRYNFNYRTDIQFDNIYVTAYFFT